MFYRLKILQIEQYTQCYLPIVEINNYNVMIDGKNFFDQPVKDNSRTYDKLRKIVTGQEDTGCC